MEPSEAKIAKDIQDLGLLGEAYLEIRVLQETLARVQTLLDHDPTNNVTPAKLREALKERTKNE